MKMAGMNEVAKLTGCTPEQVASVFDAILNLVRNGDNVVIRNFGSFREVIQKERVIHSTALEGGKATVPEAKVLRFRPSPATKIKTKAKAKARKAKRK
jgi:nucleoid DNA-binding protein